MDAASLTAIIAAVLGAGGLGAFTSFRKAGKEAQSIAASTLISVNEELRRELARRDKEIGVLRERIAVLEERMNGS